MPNNTNPDNPHGNSGEKIILRNIKFYGVEFQLTVLVRHTVSPKALFAGYIDTPEIINISAV
jgi:hypothetical protein